MELIVETLLGLLLLWLGYRLAYKGDLRPVHGYHWRTVPEEERPLFCKRLGWGQMAAGLGCLSMPWLNLLAAELGYWVGMALVLGGFAWIVVTILRHGGRLFP